MTEPTGDEMQTITDISRGSRLELALAGPPTSSVWRYRTDPKTASTGCSRGSSTAGDRRPAGRTGGRRRNGSGSDAGCASSRSPPHGGAGTRTCTASSSSTAGP